MSDYGADENPSILAAQDLAYTKGFMPLDRTNVMQWTYPDDVTVRKLANKNGKSNALFKFAPPEPPGPIPPELDPVPAGDACVICWGNGLPFGVGETPESLVVVIQDVKKGLSWIPLFGEPPNGTFELSQDPIVPCDFGFEDDDYIMALGFGPPNATFLIRNKPTMVPSFSGSGVLCSTFFVSTENALFVGGTATIFIPPIT